MLRHAREVTGMTVRATDGDVGHVDDLYFDDDHWGIRYVVVDTGGWLGGRHVLLAPVSFQRPHWDEEILPVDLTQDQVEGSPDIDLDRPVSEQQITALHEYYAWPAFWAGGYWGAPVAPGYYAGPAAVAVTEEPTGAEPDVRQEWDPDLRSVDEVTGYDIQAEDGEIGHVTDFIVDDETFVIRYLVVDTSNWLGGKHVLVAPDWISRISWPEAEVYVGLTRDQIENSPEYDLNEPVDRAYETELYDHYERTGYWS